MDVDFCLPADQNITIVHHNKNYVRSRNKFYLDGEQVYAAENDKFLGDLVATHMMLPEQTGPFEPTTIYKPDFEGNCNSTLDALVEVDLALDGFSFWLSIVDETDEGELLMEVDPIDDIFNRGARIRRCVQKGRHYAITAGFNATYMSDYHIHINGVLAKTARGPFYSFLYPHIEITVLTPDMLDTVATAEPSATPTTQFLDTLIKDILNDTVDNGTILGGVGSVDDSAASSLCVISCFGAIWLPSIAAILTVWV